MGGVVDLLMKLKGHIKSLYAMCSMSILGGLIALVLYLLIGCAGIPVIKKNKALVDNTLWTTLVVGQVVSAGNMNHQQESGYYEINPVYGKHPSKDQIYLTKVGEILVVYGLTRLVPKYKTEILFLSNLGVWGFIYYDNKMGIELKLNY